MASCIWTCCWISFSPLLPPSPFVTPQHSRLGLKTLCLVMSTPAPSASWMHQGGLSHLTGLGCFEGKTESYSLFQPKTWFMSVNTDQNYELMLNTCCHKITNCVSKVSDSCSFALKLVKKTPHLTFYLQYKYIYILFIYIYMVYICIYINMYIYILWICFIYYISYKYISMYLCQGEP